MSEGIDEIMRKAAEELGLGPTGGHPDGKLREDDAGELIIAILAHKGNVVINFGTAVKWTAFPPELARTIAKKLMDRADEAEKQGRA